jgi:hypothetical protein
MIHLLSTDHPLYAHLYIHLHIVFQATEPFYCALQGVHVLAEGKPSISFPDGGVVFAVELRRWIRRPSRNVYGATYLANGDGRNSEFTGDEPASPIPMLGE